MTTDFRSEVFKLCKKVQRDEIAQMIGKTIHDMSVVVEKKTGETIKDARSDFAYLAKHSNSEFHGFLFLDDNIDKIKLPDFFKPTALLPDDRALIERGHKTLIRFIELCLSDIAHESKIVAESMNPYYLYKDVSISANVGALLSDEDMQTAVTAFKNGTVYKALISSNFTKIFSKLDVGSMHILVDTLEKDINKSLGEDVSTDLKKFSLKLGSGYNSAADAMLAFSILMLALKTSLKLSCRLLYRAICGVNLFILNNENIINIEKEATTAICKFYKVFSQDIAFDFAGGAMGSIILMDCDLPNDTHIHEFGMIIAETLNFASEFGETAKYSFATVDSEMIHIHPLVKEILRVGLPMVKEAH